MIDADKIRAGDAVTVFATVRRGLGADGMIHVQLGTAHQELVAIIAPVEVDTHAPLPFRTKDRARSPQLGDGTIRAIDGDLVWFEVDDRLPRVTLKLEDLERI